MMRVMGMKERVVMVMEKTDVMGRMDKRRGRW
jgi:hypothetical protein